MKFPFDDSYEVPPPCIDPEVFQLQVHNRAMDFAVQAIVSVVHESSRPKYEYILLPQLEGFKPARKQDRKIEKLSELVRPETLNARIRFASSHYMPRVWKLKGEEAVNAFKIEYSILVGETLWANLNIKDLVKAERARSKRMNEMRERHSKTGEFPQYTMRHMLLSMWDGHYSHMSSRDEIADSLREENVHVTTESVNTAISELGLPKGPGRFWLDVKRVS